MTQETMCTIFAQSNADERTPTTSVTSACYSWNCLPTLRSDPRPSPIQSHYEKNEEWDRRLVVERCLWVLHRRSTRASAGRVTMNNADARDNPYNVPRPQPCPCRRKGFDNTPTTRFRKRRPPGTIRPRRNARRGAMPEDLRITIMQPEERRLRWEVGREGLL